MQILPEFLSLGLAAIEALSLHNAAEFFNQANGAEAGFNLKTTELQRKSEAYLRQEMENEVQQVVPAMFPSKGQVDLTPVLGVDFLVRRRVEAAQIVTHSLWDGKRKEMEFKGVFKSWRRWEDVGRFTCQIGTFIDIAVILVFLVAILANGMPLEVGDVYLWILFIGVSLPLLIAAICLLGAYWQKIRFMRIHDAL
jgi:hypothetical protein